MGADSLLWGSVGKDRSRSASVRTTTYSIGEKVEAYFQPSRASLFDAESGARL